MYRYFRSRQIPKTKPKVAIHDPMATQQKIRRTRQSSSSARIGCLFAGFIHYLSLTSLSENGFRGLRFMISDSASSYARDMAGTWAAVKQTHIKTKRDGSMRVGGGRGGRAAGTVVAWHMRSTLTCWHCSLTLTFLTYWNHGKDPHFHSYCLIT